MTDEEAAEKYADKILSDSKYPFMFNKQKVKAYIIKVYLDALKCCKDAYNKGLAEGRKETTYMKADEFDKSLDKCRECDFIAERKKQIDQLSVDNHVLKTAFIEQQGVINNLKEEVADPKVAMETIKKYCIEISEKYGNCSKCVFCSKGYNGCKLQTSPDNWEV